MIRTPIVLASQSAARKRLLKRLGLSFTARPAHLNEAAVQKRIAHPRALVLELSKLKARAVASGLKGSLKSAIVIGGDQVLVCQGKIFGKPGTEKKACAQLAAMSGQTVRLMTGVCVRASDGREIAFVHETKMKVRRLSREEIVAYVAYDQPLECSGSFKFESRGISLFSSVSTDDPTAIEGLPLMHLRAAIFKCLS